MQKFELEYARLIATTLRGETRQTRNGETRSIFSKTLTVPLNGDGTFPVIQGRQMYTKGVLGELAAMLRRPDKLADFEKWGCNYWSNWAHEDGSLWVDYGNAWHADSQITRLKHKLANDPTDRRMIISGWRPHMLDKLDLPCCHLLYQFYVREGKYLDMIWYQRSVDLMVGLPSDIVFAAAWLIAIAGEFGYTPGVINMQLGDCHVYAEHYDGAANYLATVQSALPAVAPIYTYNAKGKDFCLFEPKDLTIHTYDSHGKINFEVKA